MEPFGRFMRNLRDFDSRAVPSFLLLINFFIVWYIALHRCQFASSWLRSFGLRFINISDFSFERDESYFSWKLIQYLFVGWLEIWWKGKAFRSSSCISIVRCLRLSYWISSELIIVLFILSWERPSKSQLHQHRDNWHARLFVPFKTPPFVRRRRIKDVVVKHPFQWNSRCFWFCHWSVNRKLKSPRERFFVSSF